MWSDQTEPFLGWQESQFGQIEALEEGPVHLWSDLEAVCRHGEDVGVGGDHLEQRLDTLTESGAGLKWRRTAF